jgi:hypothetical protein
MLTFHHIGILTDNIDRVVENYTNLLGKVYVSPIQIIVSQQVNVCFIQISDSSFIELVQPISDKSIVYNLLKKKTSFYHMAYIIEDILSEIDRLEKTGFKALEIFNSEVFQNKRCVFIVSPDAHLIELIEK